MPEGQRRPMVISPLWLQGAVLTFLFREVAPPLPAAQPRVGEGTAGA